MALYAAVLARARKCYQQRAAGLGVNDVHASDVLALLSFLMEACALNFKIFVPLGKLLDVGVKI